jgi:hypothetical protein
VRREERYGKKNKAQFRFRPGAATAIKSSAGEQRRLLTEQHSNELKLDRTRSKE